VSAVQALHFGAADRPGPIIVASSAWNGLACGSYQTWAFRRAELTAFAESRFRCRSGARATMAAIRSLPPAELGAARLVPVATRLVQALLPGLQDLAPEARVALVLCLPERMAKTGGDAFRTQRAQLEGAVRAAAEASGRKTTLFTFTHGHAALAFALGDITQALEQGRYDVALVGGLDTYHDPDVVDRLLEEERLFDGENLDSFIPGEGGAFFTLAMPAVARELGWPELCHLAAVATAEEPATLRNDVTCLGLGLSRTARAATEPLRAGGRALDWWMSDATAESYRVQEFQLAWPRACDVMTPQSALEFLPVHLGDLGAATMPTAVAIATQGFLRQGPRARTCLITGTSVSEERGAILLAAPERKRDTRSTR
jgi:3-oxoacyl-[acyl-carrier-protein] synthase-1